MATAIDDPRGFASLADAQREPLVVAAQRSLDAGAVREADEANLEIDGTLARHLLAGDGAAISRAFERAPSAAVARHLARRLIPAWAEASRTMGRGGVAVHAFAIPLVVIVGRDADIAPDALPAHLGDTAALTALLREHDALRGNQSIALASALLAPDTLEVDLLSQWLDMQRASEDQLACETSFSGAAIPVLPSMERAHLRFLIGAALAAPEAKLFGDADDDKNAWMRPFAAAVREQLLAPGVSVLVLPRHPRIPPLALVEGRAAQRDIAAQLFASNALRRLRASVGEPDAVISAHRSVDAIDGGELRLSLSSPFDERQAEGFRCPLYRGDRVDDVAAMLIDLLHDCRVARVHVLPGVHADRDARTGLLLLFKADALATAAVLHYSQPMIARP